MSTPGARGTCVQILLPLASIWDFNKAHIHFFHKCLLSTYLVPNTVLGTADTVVNKTIRIVQGKCYMM